MKAGDSGVALIDTTDIRDFLPVMKEMVEFGERFLLTMLRWCGYGRERSEPLAFWQVFVAKIGSEPVGVTGLYRTKDTPEKMCWIGWFGVRPTFRKQGIGAEILKELKDIARKLSYEEMWVYTDRDNYQAINLYLKSGFTRLGRASDVCPRETMDGSDIVLKCDLAS